ncbi:zinc ribbon domain-containing protein, partial [Cedecea neteri]|uniref:zinc ribbon domain-containing protein n=1 Tax=Cedecea neteri TaxID=158822 RepID=UPI003916EB7D
MSIALTKCKECKKEVSSSAKTCPHCGVKNPAITAEQQNSRTAEQQNSRTA